jgi:hypothetical protein
MRSKKALAVLTALLLCGSQILVPSVSRAVSFPPWVTDVSAPRIETERAADDALYGLPKFLKALTQIGLCNPDPLLPNRLPPCLPKRQDVERLPRSMESIYDFRNNMWFRIEEMMTAREVQSASNMTLKNYFILMIMGLATDRDCKKMSISEVNKINSVFDINICDLLEKSREIFSLDMNEEDPEKILFLMFYVASTLDAEQADLYMNGVFSKNAKKYGFIWDSFDEKYFFDVLCDVHKKLCKMKYAQLMMDIPVFRMIGYYQIIKKEIHESKKPNTENLIPRHYGAVSIRFFLYKYNLLLKMSMDHNHWKNDCLIIRSMNILINDVIDIIISSPSEYENNSQFDKKENYKSNIICE